MGMNHYDVLIATPGHSMESGYVRSLMETIAELSSRGMTYKWLNAYSSLVHNAREMTATGSQGRELNPLDKGPLGDSATYNKIFWIDSDISWTVDDFFKLYDSDYDVITGAYILSDGETPSVNGFGVDGHITKSSISAMTIPIRIKSMGFGFVAIKSGVFERLDRPWFGHYSQRLGIGNDKFIETYLGEDVSWCINADRNGIELYFDPSVLVNHTKKSEISW